MHFWLYHKNIVESGQKERPMTLQEDSEYVPIAEAPILEAKRLQEVLGAHGIALHLASDPENCGSCSPKIALFIRLTDLEKFKALLLSEHARSLGDLAPVQASEEAVFDSEKAEATCPACGTVFSTQKTECSDCGLGFGVA
jgi:hypothetical protein